MKKLKVAHIMNSIVFGGAEKVNLTFFRHVDRSKFDTIPILLVRPWEDDSYLTAEIGDAGFEFVKIPVASKPDEEGRDYLRLIRCATMMRRALKTGEFDLVHTSGYFADIMGILSAKTLNLPVVSTCHGFISNNYKYRLYNKIDVFLLRYAQAVIAVSERIKSDLVTGGCETDKVTVIRNAVDVRLDDAERRTKREMGRKKFGIEKGETALGFVGRLSREKGIRYLVQAGIELINTGAAIKIIVMGEGEQHDEINDLISAHQLENSIILAGFQSNIAEILPALDLFILPSLTEGTSMALLEAMACALPIVATAVGGTPNIITHGYNGILVPSMSAKAITDAAKAILDDPDKAAGMGRAALSTIRAEFGVKDWMDDIYDIYYRHCRQVS